MRRWTIYLYENGERLMALSSVPGTTAVNIVALDDVVETIMTMVGGPVPPESVRDAVVDHLWDRFSPESRHDT